MGRRKIRVPEGYPRPGSIQAKILECLEAEPASTDEVALYVGASLRHVCNRLGEFKRAGHVRLVGFNSAGHAIYELIDPVSISLIYAPDDPSLEA